MQAGDDDPLLIKIPVHRYQEWKNLQCHFVELPKITIMDLFKPIAKNLEYHPMSNDSKEMNYGVPKPFCHITFEKIHWDKGQMWKKWDVTWQYMMLKNEKWTGGGWAPYIWRPNLWYNHYTNHRWRTSYNTVFFPLKLYQCKTIAVNKIECPMRGWEKPYMTIQQMWKWKEIITATARALFACSQNLNISILPLHNCYVIML